MNPDRELLKYLAADKPEPEQIPIRVEDLLFVPFSVRRKLQAILDATPPREHAQIAADFLLNHLRPKINRLQDAATGQTTRKDNTMTEIPDEAIEAAAEAMYNQRPANTDPCLTRRIIDGTDQ